MCARLLACPLCSQPGFLTLDALRTGLVSVATRPLACPVCNEVLLGIDKLTIHLFGHTINSDNINVSQNVNQNNVQILHNVQPIPVQTWNILKTQNMQISEVQEKNSFDRPEEESYIMKENEIHINPQISSEDQNHEPEQGQVIFLQNLSVDQMYPANCEFSKVQDNLTQKTEEKQITNSESNAVENNHMILDNSSLDQNNVNLIENNSNLILSNSNLNPSNRNLIQNNSNLIQDSGSMAQNNLNLLQDNVNLIQSDSNLSQNNSRFIENMDDNNSNILQNNVNLIQKDSSLPQNNSNLNPSNTNLIQNNSNLIQNSASLVQNNSNLLQNNADLIQTDSSLSQNNSNLIQNNSNVIQNNPSLIQQNEIQDSWIQNNSSVIIVKESAGNLEEISASNLPINENDKSTFQGKSSELSTLNENETSLKIHQVGNETPGKKQGDILPYLKAFRLLASKEKMERCNICGYRCDDRKILILHKQLVHMIAEKDMNVRPEDLLKNYPCHLCTKVFKMRGSLMVHMRVAHTNYNLGPLTNDSELSPNNDNGYNCPICGKNFKKEQHVTQHLKTHDGKQWECDVCCKMFTTKYFLKKHKRLHSGEMPYKCNICDKTFTFQQSYHKHRLYHKDDKPHTCTTCGRSFKELSTLHNHERIHTGEKPFACETCGKCFRQRVSYLVHRRIHTGVMPYKCTSCGKCFRYKVSQRTHKCQTPTAVETLAQHSELLFKRLLQISEPREKRNESFEVQAQRVEAKCSERSKFILSMNEEGEPILTRQSDLENSKEAKNDSNVESTTKENSEKEETIWIQETNNINFKESMAVSSEEQTSNAKSHLDVPADLFSMVMLPLVKDLPTPSVEMEHLRLSSPIQKENANEIIEHFSDDHNRLEMMGMSRKNIQERFEELNSLRTIDDASLSELIYGIGQE